MVDNLATEADRCRKNKGTQEPFIYVNLKQFLPSWAEYKTSDLKSSQAFDAQEEPGDGMFDKLAEASLHCCPFILLICVQFSC